MPDLAKKPILKSKEVTWPWFQQDFWNSKNLGKKVEEMFWLEYWTCRLGIEEGTVLSTPIHRVHLLLCTSSGSTTFRSIKSIEGLAFDPLAWTMHCLCANDSQVEEKYLPVQEVMADMRVMHKFKSVRETCFLIDKMCQTYFLGLKDAKGCGWVIIFISFNFCQEIDSFLMGYLKKKIWSPKDLIYFFKFNSTSHLKHSANTHNNQTACESFI